MQRGPLVLAVLAGEAADAGRGDRTGPLWRLGEPLSEAKRDLGQRIHHLLSAKVRGVPPPIAHHSPLHRRAGEDNGADESGNRSLERKHKRENPALSGGCRLGGSTLQPKSGFWLPGASHVHSLSARSLS